MNDHDSFNWLETLLRESAEDMDYPPTPDLASERYPVRRGLPPQVPALRLGFALAIISVLTLMVVPGARARVLDFFQIGGLQVIRDGADPSLLPMKSTPVPETTVDSVLDLDGVISKADLMEAAAGTFRIPDFDRVGEPDHIFRETLSFSEVYIIVWLNDSGEIERTFHILAPGAGGMKGIAVDSEAVFTEVDGAMAVWIGDSEEITYYRSSDELLVIPVHGPVLAWEERAVTYRLEADLSMEEAIQWAETFTFVPPFDSQ